MKKQDAYWTEVTGTKQAKKLLLHLIQDKHIMIQNCIWSTTFETPSSCDSKRCTRLKS